VIFKDGGRGEGDRARDGLNEGGGGREGDVEHLHAKYHLNVFIVSASAGQKPQSWANFDIRGLLYRPLLPLTAKFGVLQQTHGICLRAKFRLDWFILSSSGGEKPKILPFLDFGILWSCHLAAI